MNDLTNRIDPHEEDIRDFETERLEYEDEHGMDNWGKADADENNEIYRKLHSSNLKGEHHE